MGNIFQIVSLVAGFLTIVTVTIAIVRYLKRTELIVRVQNPKDPVKKLVLSPVDIFKGLEILTNDAHRYLPDVIIGINRGGALVGGYIAKKLNKPIVYSIDVNFDRDNRIIDYSDSYIPSDTKKILLVDDSIRSGRHMRDASAYLKTKHPNCELRRAVLLEIRSVSPSPESTFAPNPVEVTAFHSFDARVKLTWDT